MVIISDTSPLTALLLVGRGDLLTSLFDLVTLRYTYAGKSFGSEIPQAAWPV
jgi:predicted nucleic acid-binding protein